jgi:hypothetical protein
MPFGWLVAARTGPASNALSNRRWPFGLGTTRPQSYRATESTAERNRSASNSQSSFNSKVAAS